MTTNEIIALQNKREAKTGNRFQTDIDTGKGVRAVSKDGKSYLDFTACGGMNILGFGDEGIKKAIVKQTEKVINAGNNVYNETVATFADTLCTKTGLQEAVVTSGASTANEVAIQLARKFSYEKYGANRNKIITMSGSYHGQTLATLSATALPEYHRYFFPFPRGFQYVENGDGDALANAIDEYTCAVMIEPIQSKGMYPQDDEFMQFADALTKEWNVLLIVDETRSGSGQTGSLFASHAYNIAPDILTTAGGLGGGLPLGACLCSATVSDALRGGMTDVSRGTNPVSCAAGLEVLTRLDDAFLRDVQVKGAFLHKELAEMKGALKVSGMGLMVGVSLGELSAKEVARKCFEKGLLLEEAKNRLLITPALTITKDELNEGLAIIDNVLSEM